MQEKFASRLRFSFAHELGHYFLHRGTYTVLDIQTPQKWKEFILNVPDEEYRNFEWQANEFAGRFLVPRPRLEIEVGKVTEIILNKGWKKYLEKDPDVILSRVSTSISKPFGVSSETIETRVRREGLWPPII
jgi:Zn-dependent peptidase ImmA (M78 family)